MTTSDHEETDVYDVAFMIFFTMFSSIFLWIEMKWLMSFRPSLRPRLEIGI